MVKMNSSKTAGWDVYPSLCTAEFVCIQLYPEHCMWQFTSCPAIILGAIKGHGERESYWTKHRRASDLVKFWYSKERCDASATPATVQDFDHFTDHDSTSCPVAGSLVCDFDMEPCNYSSTSGVCEIPSDSGRSPIRRLWKCYSQKFE